MSVSPIISNNYSALTDFYQKKTASIQEISAQAPLSASSSSADKYTKSQGNVNKPVTYTANASVSANPREGGGYDSLLICGPAGEGIYSPGGPNDDKEMILLLGQIGINGDGKNHPYQDEDEYNAIFREIYTDVLTERGLMPQSGDLHEVKIKVGEIYKVYDEVMARVRSDQRASELAADLGIVYAEVASDAELRKRAEMAAAAGTEAVWFTDDMFTNEAAASSARERVKMATAGTGAVWATDEDEATPGDTVA